MSVRVYDPRGTQRQTKIAVASRPDHLAAAVIGLLDNTKEQAGAMLERIAAKLSEHGATPLRARKLSFSHPAEPDVLDRLRECGAVVTALGG